MTAAVFVSIIVPVYNAEASLLRTLDSISRQTLQSFEVICVDDCSADGTAAILQEFATRDSRFKVVRLPTNSGVASARNAGIAVATGLYLCFLDADDWWLPEKLAIQFAAMEEHGISLTYMSYIRASADSSVHKEVHPPATVTYEQLLCSNHIGNLTGMVRRDLVVDNHICFKKIGHEDYEFWLAVLKVAKKAHRVQTATPLCFYWLANESLSSNKIKAARWQWHIYRKAVGLGWWLSIRYFVCYMAFAVIKRV